MPRNGQPCKQLGITCSIGCDNHKVVPFYFTPCVFNIKGKKMKIILSRKGFDSTAGGYPSPIIDNKLISIPIPDENEKIKYSDLYFEDKSYFEILQQLIRNNLVLNNKRIKLDLQTKCHLDPDINKDCLKDREEKWKRMFGQVDGAQTILEGNNRREGVHVGDLFLFFGWFKNTRKTAETKRLMYCGNDKHIMWGYFEIGEIIKTNTKNIEYWNDWQYHPHIKNDCWLNKENNTIYIANEKLSFNSRLPGAGRFDYNENLVLTKNNHPRTHWKLPECFKSVEISYHPSPWKELKGEKYFQSNPIGQEFVVEENKKIEEWAINIVNRFGKP